MQKQKRKTVDEGFCDRFIEVYQDSGLTGIEFVKRCGLSSQSGLNEISRHVTQPSLNMVTAVCREFGISADWLLFGVGSKYLEEHRECDPFEGMEAGLRRIREEMEKLRGREREIRKGSK